MRLGHSYREYSPMSTISTQRASYQRDTKAPGYSKKKPCNAKQAELLLDIAKEATRMTEATTVAAYTLRKQKLLNLFQAYLERY